MAVNPIPEGANRITPSLSIKGAADAIAFYKKAFGAEETFSMPGPDGKIMHAELKINGANVMLADEMPQSPGGKSPTTAGTTTVGLFLYVEQCDDWYNKAIAAGATSVMAPQDMFWGDRFASVSDPFGHSWSFATHIKDVTREEMAAGMPAMAG
ncbi:MAG: VOC family protein [bacterium]